MQPSNKRLGCHQHTEPVNGQWGSSQRIHMTYVSHFWRLWRCTSANLCTTAGRRSKARRRRSDLSVQVAKDMIRFWPDLSRSDYYQWVSVWAWLMEPQGDDLVYIVSLFTISCLTENSFTTMKYLRQCLSQVCLLSLKAQNSWVEIVQSFYRCLSNRVWVSCFNHIALIPH